MCRIVLLLVDDNRQAFLTSGCPRGDNPMELLTLADGALDSRTRLTTSRQALPSLRSRRMKVRARQWTIYFLLSGWLCSLFLSQLAAQTSRRSDIAVVVHPDTPIRDLNLEEVRTLFRGERPYWRGNAKLRVVLLTRAPGTRERDVLLKSIYRMTEAQYYQYWHQKLIAADVISAPRKVESNGKAIAFLTTTPGTIALIDHRDVDVKNPGVKVLRVDGHLPGDPDYSLR